MAIPGVAVNGLVHVIGAMSVTEIQKDVLIHGVLISEGRVRRESGSAPSTITRDPTIAANPPLGYASGTNAMVVVPGSWRWEAR